MGNLIVKVGMVVALPAVDVFVADFPPVVARTTPATDPPTTTTPIAPMAATFLERRIGSVCHRTPGAETRGAPGCEIFGGSHGTYGRFGAVPCAASAPGG